MENWIQELPRSQMTYPASFDERVKYWFWKIYTPFHPYLRDVSMYLGVVRHEGRQDFLIGRVNASRSVRELVSFLVARGFGNHFIAWKDTGELVSLRRAVDFKYQYHVRIFTDGEVRCHYEYTPECHPVLHLREIGVEDRAEEFKTILQDWIVPVP